MDLDKKSEPFYTLLVQFVELKEGHPDNHHYQWNRKDLLYVRAALNELTESQRIAFHNQFKDYQITKALSIVPQEPA